jgi:hypothetical protein
MARSKYIYLVYIDGNEFPEATFTVKHEAISYIERTFSFKETIRLYAMSDGPSGGLRLIEYASAQKGHD